LTIVFDPFCGVSGDMILSSLLDLFPERRDDVISKLENLGRLLGIELKIKLEEVKRGGIPGKLLVIESDAMRIDNPMEMLRTFSKLCSTMNFPEKISKTGKRILLRIFEAESRAHGVEMRRLHLHETGDIDTQIEVIGTLILLEDESEVYSTPISIGKGYVRTEHGLMPVPTPATAQIMLKSAHKFRLGPVEGELATPTGVAILSEIARPIPDSMSFNPTRIGHGAGSMELKEIPNLLRAYLLSHEKEEILYMVETSIDDVTPEILSKVQEDLGSISLDVYLLPTLMKKGRLGHTLKCLVEGTKLREAIEKIFESTGTLGVRYYSVKREKLEREEVKLNVPIGERKFKVRFKVSYLPSGGRQIKAEYDDLKRISDEVGLPIRIVKEEAERIARKEIR